MFFIALFHTLHISSTSIKLSVNDQQNRIRLMEEVTDWAHLLETKQIIGYINELDLLHNPWFIAGAVLFVLISLFMKWKLLLTTTITIAALITLVTVVSGQGTDVSKSSDGIFIFLGGGAAIMFFFIYMTFMRGD